MMIMTQQCNVITILSDYCRSEGCDVLVCIQPTISDGRLAPVLAQQWGKGENHSIESQHLDLILLPGIVF